jgi:DNA-binding ferritin-like protein (Dps family)
MFVWHLSLDNRSMIYVCLYDICHFYYQVTNVIQTYIYHWSITKWQMSYKHTYIIDLLSSDKCHTNIHISLIYYQVTNVIQTYIYHWSITKWQMSYKHTYIIDLLSSDKCHTNIHISLISSMILHWCHWRQTLPMISILMLICFAWNGLLNVSHISDFAFDMILLWEIHSHKANQRCFKSLTCYNRCL